MEIKSQILEPGTKYERQVSFYLKEVPWEKTREVYHAKLGPAVIWKMGDLEWWEHGDLRRIEHANGDYACYLNGKLHSDSGPAYVGDGRTEYHQHGLLHREDGPAIDSPNETAYYFKGKLHRLDGPASLTYRGNECPFVQSWWQHGELHRNPAEGPAYISADGRIEYYWNGVLHNPYGYASFIPYDRMEWWLNGKRHREDGPAMETTDLDGAPRQYYYLNNRFLSKTEWKVASRICRWKRKASQLLDKIRSFD